MKNIGIRVKLKKVTAFMLALFLAFTSVDVRAFAEETGQTEQTADTAVAEINADGQLVMTQTVDGVTITLTADQGVFPEHVSMQAKRITDTDTISQIENTIQQTAESGEDGEDVYMEVTEQYSFDIKVLDEAGNEIEPDTANGTVHVTFQNLSMEDENDALQDLTAGEENGTAVDETSASAKAGLEESTAIYHVDTEDSSAELMEQTEDTEKAEISELSMDTTHFSTYTIATTKKWQVPAWNGTTSSTSRTLSSGNYAITKNTMITAGSRQSALTISGTVYLYIMEGVTLTVKGGAGSYQSAGGAGIYLSNGNFLYLLGSGKVVAAGGNAGSGSTGGSGGNAGYIDSKTDYIWGGTGGYGGAGGGGAGAGIGTAGGYGASATSTKTSGSTSTSHKAQDGGKGDSKLSGESGYYGNTGSSAASCGVLYALDQIQIEATGGAGGGAGAGGSSGGGWNNSSTNVWTGHSWAGGAGGGGGGGGGGLQAVGIGTGGGGGGSGASGGTGGTWYEDAKRNGKQPNAGGGAGGYGYSNGRTGGGSQAYNGGSGGYRGGYTGNSSSALTVRKSSGATVISNRVAAPANTTTPTYEPYYTKDGDKVAVYANGASLVIQKDSEGNTCIYYDKNSNGSVDSTDAILQPYPVNDVSENAIFGEENIIEVYGGGEQNEYSAYSPEITMHSGKVADIYAGGNQYAVGSASVSVLGGTVTGVVSLDGASCTVNGTKTFAVGGDAVVGTAGVIGSGLLLDTLSNPDFTIASALENSAHICIVSDKLDDSENKIIATAENASDFELSHFSMDCYLLGKDGTNLLSLSGFYVDAVSDALTISAEQFAQPVTYTSYSIKTTQDGAQTDMGALVLKSDSGNNSYTLTGTDGSYELTIPDEGTLSVYYENEDTGVDVTAGSEAVVAFATFDITTKVNGTQTAAAGEVSLKSESGAKLPALYAEQTEADGIMTNTGFYHAVVIAKDSPDVYQICVGQKDTGVTVKAGEHAVVDYVTAEASVQGNTAAESVVLKSLDGKKTIVLYRSEEDASDYTRTLLAEQDTQYALYVNNLKVDGVTVTLNEKSENTVYLNTNTIRTQVNDADALVGDVTAGSNRLQAKTTGVYQFVTASADKDQSYLVTVKGKDQGTLSAGEEMTVSYYTVEYADGGVQTEDELPKDEKLYQNGEKAVLLDEVQSADGSRIFKGWKINGEIKQPGDTITISDQKADVEAAWDNTVYTISYDLGAGEDETVTNEGNPESYTTDDTFTLQTPQREGYLFTGWTTTGVFSPVKELTIPQGSAGNKKFTAHWEAMSWQIKSDYDEIDLGTRLKSAGNENKQAVMISNTGNQTVHITAACDNGFTVEPAVSGYELKPGEVKEVVVSAPQGELGAGKYTGNLTVTTAEDNGNTLTIPLTFTLGKDAGEPEGTITVETAERASSWTDFQYKDRLDDTTWYTNSGKVTITGQDDESGIKQIEYYVSKAEPVEDSKIFGFAYKTDKDGNETDEKMPVETVKWEEYSEDSAILLEEDGVYYVYARITDNSDNVTYVSTERVIVDNEAPEFYLADDEKTPMQDGDQYIEQQSFIAEDTYLDKVTLKLGEGQEEELTPDENGVYTIHGRKDEAGNLIPQTLTAYDKSGNQTVITVTVTKDTTPPTGEITLKNNKWTTKLNEITFGLFFKKTQDVTISASDEERGVESISYYLYSPDADKKALDREDLEQLEDTAWVTGELRRDEQNDKNGSIVFRVNPDKKFVIYAKLVDAVGNTSYINSDGIVLYSDAGADTKQITYKRGTNTAVTADVKLNGNLINNITNREYQLSDDDYEVDENGTITFKPEYLQKLPASETPYTLVISYRPMGESYVEGEDNEAPETTSLKLSVTKSEGVIKELQNLSKTYDGEPAGIPSYKTNSNSEYIKIQYKPGDAEDDAYQDEAPVDAGSYYVRVIIGENDDYTAVSTVKAFTISNASQNAPELTPADETIDERADGKIEGLTIDMEWRRASAQAGVSAALSYTKVTDADMNFADGTYEVRYAAKANYDASPAAVVTIKAGRMLNITVPEEQTGYTLIADKDSVSWNGTAELKFALKEGYRTTDAFAVKANDTVLQPEEDGIYVLDGIQEDQVITVSGIVDGTAPSGTVTVDERNAWQSFVNKITFGLFFKDTKTVTITAEDRESGVDQILYYVSDQAYTESELSKQLASIKWSVYKEPFKLEQNGKYVVYAKITDKQGNITYVSSDGLVIDKEAAVILGVEDQGAYPEGKTFQVEEENLKTVKIDGVIVTPDENGNYTLPPKKGTYTIEAEDMAGNITKLENITVRDLQKEKEEAENALADQAETAGKAIDAMTDLTPEQRKEAKAAVKKLAEEAQKELSQINDVRNIDKISEIVEKSGKDLEEITNKYADTDLSNAKAKAENAIDQRKEEAESAIDAMPNLTDKQKEEAKDKLGQKADEAKKELEQIKNPADKPNVSECKDQTFEAFEQLEEDAARNDLLNLKEAAKSDITSRADAAKAAIDDLTDLTAQEKKDAKAAIDEKAEEAKQAVESVSDSADQDKIKEAKKQAAEAFEDVTSDAVQKDLSNAKDKAKEEVTNRADAKKASIDAMPGLTDEEKEEAKRTLDESADAAKKKIDNITDSSKKYEIDDIRDQALDTLEKAGEEAAKNDLENLKKAAEADITKRAEEAKSAIDELPDLTAKEKTEAKNAIDRKASEAKSAIDSITDPDNRDQITDEKKAAFDEFDSQKEAAEEKDFANAKEKAKAELEKRTDDVKTAIDAMPNLTEDQKTAAKAKADDQLKKAKSELDQAKTPEEKSVVEGRKDTNLGKLDRLEEAAARNDLEILKEAAKSNITSRAEEAKSAIDDLTDLTDDERKAAKEEIDRQAENAKAEIEKITDPAEKAQIKDQKKTAEEAFNKQKEAAAEKDLSNAKEKAKAEIDQRAESAKASISKMPALTEEEIKEAQAAIEKEAQDAKNLIDQISDSANKSKVESQKNSLLDKLDQVEEEAAKDDLSNSKEAAKSDIDSRAEEAIAAIEDLTDLTEKQKEDAIAEIKKNAEEAKTAIDEITAAADKGKIKDTKESVIAEINKQKEDSKEKDLSNAKENAKAEIDERVKDAEAAIDRMPNLSDDEKAEAKKELAKQAESAKTKLDEIIDPANKSKVESQKNTAMDTLDKVEEKAADNDLSNLKEAAKTDITNRAEKVKSAIDNLTDLTDEEKEAAKAEIDQKAESAKAEIEKVTDPAEKEQINDQKKTAEDSFDQKKKEAETADLSNAKKNAKAEIDQRVKDAEAAIDNMPNLSEDEKAEAKKELAKQAEEAKAKLDQITDPANKSNVEIEKNTTLDRLDQSEEAAADNDLSNLKEAAKTDIENRAEEAKAAIDAMQDLTTEQKEAAKAEIDKKAEEAKEEINKITDSSDQDAVKEAKDSVLTAVEEKKKESENTNNTNKIENMKKAEEAESKLPDIFNNLDIKISTADEASIKRDVENALEKADITNADVTVTGLKKEPAKLFEKGSVTGTVEVKVGSQTKIVEVDKELPELSTYVTYTSTVASDAPKTDVAVDEHALMENILTENELDTLANGGNSDILLHVQNKEVKPDDSEHRLVEEILTDNAKVGKYLDISLLLTVKDAEGRLVVENEKIHEPDTPFTISVNIPEELKASGRTYQIVRVHDSVAEILPSVYDAAAQTLTFETDRFSTYAILYTDTEQKVSDNNKDQTDHTQAENTDNKTGSTNQQTGQNTSAKRVKSADTGDVNTLEWIITLLPVGVYLLLAGRRRRKH